MDSDWPACSWKCFCMCYIFCIALLNSVHGQVNGTCGQDGNIRLVDGTSSLNGRVEFCVNGVWGTVCDDFWDNDDAKVVCRQLGHSTEGARADTSNSNPGTGPIYFDNVECTGRELLLVNCSFRGLSVHDCSHFEDAGVHCEEAGFSCDTGAVKLKDGLNAYQGRVEVCIGNTFTTVCDNEWDFNEASVVCRQLNFANSQGTPIALSGGKFGFGIGNVNLAGLQCDGTESDLTSCNRTFDFFSSVCSHFNDAGVLCPQPNPTCEDGQIRLFGNSTPPNEGRIEVCYNGVWGTVCHNGWGPPEAQVVCRELGYSSEGAIPLGFADFGAGEGLIFLSNVQCNGTESRLSDCPSRIIGQNFCFHQMDSGVICMDPNVTCDEGDLRLVGGDNPSEGRLEVCYFNHWGTVCDDNFGLQEAALVCRLLGFPSEGALALHLSFFGPGVGLILIDDVECFGNETSIINCSHIGIGQSNCLHYEDVSILCQITNATCTNGDIRLVNGTGIHSGRVEVCFNSRWGTICDDNWDSEDANVVCRQLNYPGESVALSSAYFGSGTGPIFLDDLECSTFNHTKLIECFDTLDQVGIHNCDHIEDASVICSTVNTSCGETRNGGVRLTGGASDLEGRVEVCLDGVWGTICNNFWNNLDAAVVCHQLNLGRTDSRAVLGSNYGAGSGPIFFDNVFCRGTEILITNCQRGFTTDCSHTNDAGVVCSGIICENGDVRLVDGRLPSEGRVEVCVDMQYGTVCDDLWDNSDAMVVCRQLGFNNGAGAIALPRSFFGEGEQLIHLANVDCFGNETGLLDCNSASSFYCFHFEDAGIVCQSENASRICQNGQIRLRGGDNSYEGRVEVCFNGHWGTVCHSLWDATDAQTVCNILGLGDGRLAIPTTTNFFPIPRPEGPVLVSNVNCSGTETTFLSCLSTDPGDHICSHALDAGVFCSVSNDSFECQTGEVRLTDAPDRSGRVEVCINGKWGTVCSFGWGPPEIEVVCQQLRNRPNIAGQQRLPTFLAYLECTGNEDNLLQCPGSGPGTFCFSEAYVTCLESCVTGDLRLVGGTVESEGTVEVCVDNEWDGNICDDGWSHLEAQVVCRQLGYPTKDAIGVPRAFFGPGSYPILVAYIGCFGNETRLSNCVNNTSPFCTHSEDAGVICPSNTTRNCTNGDLRLVDGVTKYEGRVELCLHDRWGTICDDNWDRRDAQVVCNHLRYYENEADGIAVAVSNGIFGTVTSPIIIFNGTNSMLETLILLDQVECYGNESTLLECSAQPVGSHNCDHSEDAGVFCPVSLVPHTCSNGDIRLQNQSREGVGRVEFCLGDYWTTLCQTTFFLTSANAQVACRQLGYTSPEQVASIYAAVPGTGRVIPIDINCNGDEESLADCPHFPFPLASTLFLCSSHLIDAGVICIAPNKTCNDGDIRLSNGATDNEGRVEICFNEVWGSICDDSWDRREVTVVCRELGYTDDVNNLVVLGAFFGKGENAIHLDDLACIGNETKLANCSHPPVGIHNCDHAEDVGVVCSVANSVCNAGDVQLVNGPTDLEGRLEVCFGGRWGTVCDDLWDRRDSAVICGQLGHSREGSSSNSASALYGAGNDLIMLDSVQCTGTETNILQCPADDPGLHNCGHSEDIGIVCQPAMERCVNGSVRLVGGGEVTNEGTVEFCLNRAWGTVCSRGWGVDDANVVCNQLGFPSTGAIGVRSAFFGSGSGEVLIRNVACFGNETSLEQCMYSLRPIFCRHSNDAGVICASSNPNCTTGNVQLADGRNNFEGRVEVCFNGRWGTVCDDGWDNTDADVVCRQLGITGPSFAVKQNRLFGSGNGFILLDDLNCDGTESNLLECRSTTEHGINNCRPSEDAAIFCSNPNATCSNRDLRLVTNVEGDVMGRVEMCLGGQWLTICGDRDWQDVDARVVCRELGYKNISNSRAITALGGSGPVVLSQIQCTGNESSLADCRWAQFRPPSFYCTIHIISAGVICAASTCSDGDVRLLNGTLVNEGRVEICFNNQWGTVCDDRWDENEARVVCKQLGFGDWEDSVAYGRAFYGIGITSIHLDELNCNGSENFLKECKHSGIGIHDCSNSEDAGVLCIANSTTCYHGQLRLLDGKVVNQGRVEICIGGKWGTVCDDLFGKLDAAVICRQLGYQAEGANVTDFGAGTGPIFLDDLQCLGNETNILDCGRPRAGNHNCRHFEDVGVTCAILNPNLVCSEGDIKLVGGGSDHKGTVQFCYGDMWGTVCDDLWDNRDAQVVCRQLGFSATNALGLRGAFFGRGPGDILASNVACSGREDRLLNCSLSLSFFCSHIEDAGVLCSPEEMQNCSNGDVRLRGGSNAYEGRVEVCLHGHWGTVCDDSWDFRDAAVVCRQLGYEENGASYPINNARFGPGEGLILMDDVMCVGNETTLLNCRARDIGSHNCIPTEDAGVFCPYPNSPCPNGAVRLAGGTEYDGRVEICLGGVWGTICRTFSWRDQVAQVICRTLGFNDTQAAVAQTTISRLYGETTSPILVTSPSCTGLETKITDCSGFNNGRLPLCQHMDDVGVICLTVNQTNCTNGDVRLVDGATVNEGRVEVCVKNSWGTVCDDNFDVNEAQVVCRQLGYNELLGSVPLSRAFFGRGSNRIHLDDIDCNGSESNLLMCPNAGQGQHNCNHFEDAGVICTSENPNCTYGEVRLMDGSNKYEGRVEICFGGRFGTVCDDLWDILDAAVVCSELGFSADGATPFSSSRFGTGEDMPIFIDDTRCIGNESGLVECSSSGIGFHNCLHVEDAGVRCKPKPCTSDTVQLVGSLTSNTSQSGQVEVCNNGSWVPVCADSFDNANATIVCLSLGLEDDSNLAIPTLGQLFDTPEYSNRENYFTLSGTCLAGSCNFTSSETQCRSGLAGVLCPLALSSSLPGAPTTCMTGSLQLKGGSSPSEGRVEVCINDKWGTICDDSFDGNVAAVICKQLGFLNTIPEAVHGKDSSTEFGIGSGDIWLDDVKCTGMEENIFSCSQLPLSQENNCQHHEDSGVRCLGKASTMPSKEPTKKSGNGGESGKQTGGSSTGAVIPLVVVIVVLVIIVLTIVFIIIAIVVVKARRIPSKLQFENEDDNPFVESDFLGKEHEHEDIPMDLK